MSREEQEEIKATIRFNKNVNELTFKKELWEVLLNETRGMKEGPVDTTADVEWAKQA